MRKNRTIAGKITEVKLRYGLDDFQLAELLHIGAGAIAQAEAGKRKPPAEPCIKRLNQLLDKEGENGIKERLCLSG